MFGALATFDAAYPALLQFFAGEPPFIGGRRIKWPTLCWPFLLFIYTNRDSINKQPDTLL